MIKQFGDIHNWLILAATWNLRKGQGSSVATLGQSWWVFSIQYTIKENSSKK